MNYKKKYLDISCRNILTKNINGKIYFYDYCFTKNEFLFKVCGINKNARLAIECMVEMTLEDCLLKDPKYLNDVNNCKSLRLYDLRLFIHFLKKALNPNYKDYVCFINGKHIFDKKRVNYVIETFETYLKEAEYKI